MKNCSNCDSVVINGTYRTKDQTGLCLQCYLEFSPEDKKFIESYLAEKQRSV